MSLGVKLPITEENVIELKGEQILNAHDLLLISAQGQGDEYEVITNEDVEQYRVVRKEIIRRLKSYDDNKRV